MRAFSLKSCETIIRPYGLMRRLVGGKALRTKNVDLRILEIRPGESTTTHHHLTSESIFYVMAGTLEVAVDGELAEIEESGGVVVEPQEVHVVRNIGRDVAYVLEAMAPPFKMEDTIFQGEQVG